MAGYGNMPGRFITGMPINNDLAEKQIHLVNALKRRYTYY
jgi:hypothetical protein